jgi:uncharacterized protein
MATTEQQALLEQRLGVSQQAIAQFCQRWQIREMALFGSILRNDFRADSDVDVLVSFLPEARVSLLGLVDLQDALAGLWGRSVDVMEKEAIEASPNWIRRREILNTATLIYGA